MQLNNLQQIVNQFKHDLNHLQLNHHIQCPVCSTNVGTYKRSINQGQILFLYELFEMYLNTKQLYHYYGDVLKNVETKYGRKATDYAKLTKFELIISKGEHNDDGNSSGYFAITKLGARFLNGEVSIPKYIIESTTGVLIEKSKNLITIDQYVENFKFNKLLNKNPL